MSVVHDLFTAAQSNNVDMMRNALLSPTVDVNMRSENEGFTPLMVAANYGFFDLVEMLLAAGADVNAQSDGGTTALILAVSPKQEESAKIISRLLEGGAKVNLVSGGGNSALMEAAYQANTAVIEVLLRSGADINMTNNHGETALMTTLVGGDEPELITRLLQAGADKERITSEGEQAVDIAHRLSRVNSFRVLSA